MSMKNEQKLAEYAEEKAIKFIVLFGSRAFSAETKESDYDVAIFLKHDKDFFADFGLYSDMLDYLSKILQIGMNELDLTDMAKANILLRYEITSKGKLLYGNKDEYAEFQAFAFRDYIDAKPLFDLEGLLIKKRQELIKQAI
ncbi:MAG: nucleotidyltransferase domain-containing protein [bacterium]|nr:nucleotidyltransferase domain-containing protein [bacterium]